MSISIPDLLEGILEATAAEAAAKARIVAYRGALEDEARRRLTADGAAPSWNAPALGKVRLEPPGDWTPTVADPDAWASYVAEHHPTEATAVIAIEAAYLEDTLEALHYAGVTPIDTRVEVRSAWAGPYLKSLAVEVESIGDGDAEADRDVTIADTTTGAIIPGLTATRSAAKLVVSLDRDRRTAVVDEARTSANAAIADAIGEDQAAANLVALDVTRRELEALHGDQLATIAKAHGLGSSGTKAALAERIARAEHATGRVVRPAATVEGTVHPAEQPVGLTPDGKRTDDAPHGSPTTMSLGEALAIHATRDGGFTTPEIELERARLDLGRDPTAEDLKRASIPPLAVEHPVHEVKLTSVDDDLIADGTYLDGLSREVLRKYAKAHGISAAGTKGDLIDRLVAAGTTVVDVNNHARGLA